MVGHTRYITDNTESGDGRPTMMRMMTLMMMMMIPSTTGRRHVDGRASSGHTSTTGHGTRARGPNTGMKGYRHRHQLARRCGTSEERDTGVIACTRSVRATPLRASGAFYNKHNAYSPYSPIASGVTRCNRTGARRERSTNRSRDGAGEKTYDGASERASEQRNEGARTTRIWNMNTPTCTRTCGRGKRGHILRRGATRRDAKRRIASRRSSKSATTLGRRVLSLYTLHGGILSPMYTLLPIFYFQTQVRSERTFHVVIIIVVVVTRPLLFFFFPLNPYPALS